MSDEPPMEDKVTRTRIGMWEITGTADAAIARTEHQCALVHDGDLIVSVWRASGKVEVRIPVGCDRAFSARRRCGERAQRSHRVARVADRFSEAVVRAMKPWICTQCGRALEDAHVEQHKKKPLRYIPHKGASILPNPVLPPGRYHLRPPPNDLLGSFFERARWCGPVRPRNEGDEYVQWAEQGGWS